MGIHFIPSNSRFRSAEGWTHAHKFKANSDKEINGVDDEGEDNGTVYEGGGEGVSDGVSGSLIGRVGSDTSSKGRSVGICNTAAESSISLDEIAPTSQTVSKEEPTPELHSDMEGDEGGDDHDSCSLSTLHFPITFQTKPPDKC